MLVAVRAFASKAKPAKKAAEVKTARSVRPPNVRRTIAPAASAITDFDSVPEDYTDDEGLPFRRMDLTDAEAVQIFGKGMNAASANHIMRVIHGRRVSGTLPDPSLPTADSVVSNLALEWLRANVPVDEDECAARRAELELAQMESDIVSDAERIGIYKPNNYGADKSSSPHSRSVLDDIRAAKEREADEADARREAQKKEIMENTGTLTTVGDRGEVVLGRREMHPRLKYYLDKAANTAPLTVPKMPLMQRIGPSLMFTALIVALCVGFAMNYKPMVNRLWSDIPPAAATTVAIVGLNVFVWCLWRFPPAFAMLQKYFIALPGYPRAASMLLNTFSHIDIRHLLLNMIGVSLVAPKLHDDVGRGNFLAVYLSCGVFASFFSLALFSIRKVFITSSVGASGAIMGILSCYLYLHHDKGFKLFGYPANPDFKGLPGWVLLTGLVSYELASMYRGKRGVLAVDHYAHLGGIMSGVTCGEIIRRDIEHKRRADMERRKNMSMVERIKELRSS